MEKTLPKFIVIEGIDGSGKSTLCKNLSKKLNEIGQKTLDFFEPTKGVHGQKLRKYLRKEISLQREEVLELFLEDRAHSVSENILKNQKLGYHIILDRYFFSMAAYQGDEITTSQKILEMNLSRNFPQPDLLFYLQIEPELAFKRIQDRNQNTEVFESLDSLIRISSNYKSILPDTTIYLDAQKEQTELVSDCLQFFH
jgi:dTMP kinase